MIHAYIFRSIVSLSFFFQAEDGIRDRNVTGVQTCALPICPRDGLQNEATPLTVQDKVNFIHALAETGLTYIEAGSFVSPKWVPQMAGSGAVFGALKRKEHITYAALTPKDRKSTRLNSSHVSISYAVFC